MGSIQAKLAKTNSPDADIVELSKVTDIIAEVLNGKLDGAYVETIVAEAYAKNYPDLYVAMDVPYEAAGNVVGVNKSNAPLQAAVNLAIKAAIDDGSLARSLPTPTRPPLATPTKVCWARTAQSPPKVKKTVSPEGTPFRGSAVRY